MAHRIVHIPATPAAFALEKARAALLIIDMQRDFLEPGGFGEALGNDVSHLRRAIAPNMALMEGRPPPAPMPPRPKPVWVWALIQ